MGYKRLLQHVLHVVIIIQVVFAFHFFQHKLADAGIPVDYLIHFGKVF
jgi:hypothetical protein